MSRVLFIITQSEIGGAQRFLLEFAPYLASRGHEIIVAAGEGDGELFEKVSGVAISTRNIKSLVRTLNPVKDLAALISILKIISKDKPSILFLQSTKAGFLGSLAAMGFKILDTRYKIRVIYRIGGWAFNDPRPWWMNQIVFWMEKISAHCKDVVIVNSEYDRKLAIEKKIAPPERVVKIYNGIEPEKLIFLPREEAQKAIMGYRAWTMPPRRASLDRGEGNGEEKLVGTIANLYATKGIEYLIKAAYYLSHSPYPTSHIPYFIVVGEGPKRSELEARIKKYNLASSFFLLGRIPNATQYLKALDVFVLPSAKEGFPWVLLEAMAAEVPIVATKVGAVPEIIEDGKNGLLAPPKDAHALAQKIHSLVNIQDTHDREYLALSSKEKLAKFSLQKMLAKSEETITTRLP